MTFDLPPLPYDYNALEPTIDAETMRIHHDKHHKAYTDKLNEAVAADPGLQGLTIEEILATISSKSPAIRNNGGGYWNHAFFWRTMRKGGGEPSGALAEAITRDFGDLAQLQAEFNTKGAGQFGSGWAWLIVDTQGRLKVTSTPNQDSPLMDVVGERGTPLIANDVWEHAYYLSYRNDRAAYLKAWWSIVDWDEVARRYATAIG